MSNRTTLRAVGKDEKPAAPKPPKTVPEAAKSGTPRELLVAMRDLVAEALIKPNCPPREFTALTKRLQDIVRDIEVIDAREDDGERVAKLEAALREVVPDHPLISDVVSDAFDSSVI